MSDLLKNTTLEKGLTFSQEGLNFINELKAFNYEKIYSNDKNRLADQYFNLVLNTIYEVLKFAKNQILQENINSLYAEVIEEFACWLKNYCINEEFAENKKLKNNKIYNINKPEDYATAVVEYIAGMTDNKAIDTYNKIISF